MLFSDITLPITEDKPFFYTSFVSTVDGKIKIRGPKEREYWPIGSTIDYRFFNMLRAHADALIDGKSTSQAFQTLQSINDPEFLAQREKLGKARLLPYFVLSNNPDSSLNSMFDNSVSNSQFLVTSNQATVKGLAKHVEVVRLGETHVDLHLFAQHLFEKKHLHSFTQAGPTLFGALLKARLIREIFLTLAPRIFGNTNSQALTLGEGKLFGPNEINLELISLEQAESELFLRYKVFYAH